MAGDIIGRSTGIISNTTGVMGWISQKIGGAISWVIHIHPFVKLCVLCAIIFIVYSFWELNNYIKYLQKEAKTEAYLQRKYYSHP